MFVEIVSNEVTPNNFIINLGLACDMVYVQHANNNN